ncbi:VOC family protein [Paraburkholderia sp.]|uniref:VOC family protein n=1 Tax=Paraburkholderia sp. TaxID=1926495 RepID=UPI002397E1BB|nr:VOC family protein [Paraburkholderia sp.]MDE1182827.1 VOC family protein [Paraburkholderia sp.]
MIVQPYVFFSGRCEEALQYYTESLGAEVVFKMHFKDAPPDAERPVRPGTEDKVMHVQFRIGSTEVMASDGNCDPSNDTHSGFSLALTADDAPSGERMFQALADGGQVMMPWQATFWTTGFGMLSDRFGIPWMVMVRAEPPA